MRVLRQRSCYVVCGRGRSGADPGISNGGGGGGHDFFPSRNVGEQKKGYQINQKGGGRDRVGPTPLNPPIRPWLFFIVSLSCHYYSGSQIVIIVITVMVCIVSNVFVIDMCHRDNRSCHHILGTICTISWHTETLTWSLFATVIWKNRYGLIVFKRKCIFDYNNNLRPKPMRHNTCPRIMKI